MNRLLACLCAALLGLSAFSVCAQTAGKRTLTFAVSEGTSGGIDADAARAKYQPLADMFGRALGQDVRVVFVREFAALEKGMQDNQFDLVLARPSDYPARGLRDYRYQFVATATPDGQCMLVVPKNSPIKSVAELKGKTFILPEKTAYMTRFCRAELRDRGIDVEKENVFYVREQGAIPFSLENGITEVGGLASYSGAYKQWVAKGHRVLHQSVPQPYQPVVASPSLAGDQVAKVRDVLLGLQGSDGGRQILSKLGVSGFVATEEPRLRKLLDWLKV